MPIGSTAKHFEDFTTGDSFVTQGRTLTDVDNTLWTMFTGDMNPMHVDEVHAREHGLYGGRFPAGLLAVAVASGLNERLGMFAGTGLAMTQQSVTYRKPVLIGDTIAVRLTVTETLPKNGRPFGAVTFGYEIVRQDDDVCIDGSWTIIVKSRGAGVS